MGIYTLETQRGRKLKIEAANDADALDLADKWDLEDHAASEATRMGVNPDLILRQMQRESGGRANAVSPKGARGPMQLMPGTAKELGVDPDDPYANITGGVTYMRRQLDDFGGDERQALAAYNAGPGAVRKHGGIPPFPETQAYVNALSGQGKATPRRVPVPQLGPGVTAERAGPEASTQKLRPDDGLGFLKGSFAPIDNAANWMVNAIEGSSYEKPLAQMGVGARSLLPDSLVQFLENPQGYYDKKAGEGVRPGKLGEFAGNVAGTAWVPGRPLIQGAISSGLLSDADTAGGLAGDMALGGVTARIAALGGDAMQAGAKRLLSKAPAVAMGLEGLEKAVKEAYAKVDASGYRIPKLDMQSLAASVATDLRNKGGPKGAKLYPDADAFVARLKSLASQKGGVSVTQLDDLRSDIYDAMIKPGGKESGVGKAIRAKIDTMIDAIPNGDIRAARELYTRLSKFRAVTNKLDSADLRKSAAYTGTNTDNTIRQQLRPLTDPTSGQRIRNATKDETAAVRRVVAGTATQNLARNVSHLFDPRRLMSMPASAISGTTALSTHGLSLIPQVAGLVSTVTANRASQKNVQALLDLIAAGGSKSALARTATNASYQAERALAALRPALIAASAPTVAAAREKPKPKPPQKRPAR